MSAARPSLRVDEAIAAASLLLPGTSPRLDAELLLAHVLDCSRTALFTHPENRLDKAQQARYRALIERRRHGEPLAYLVGTREFWSLQLDVSPAVLVPRPETETLVEAAIELLQPGMMVVDAGTGTGAIALALRSEQDAGRVLATDISHAALAIAHGNARRLDLDVTFVCAAWLGVFVAQTLDLVVSNPPYIVAADPHLETDGVAHEPRLALVGGGTDGLDAIRKLVVDAHRCLRSGGWFATEHGYDQAETVRNLLRDSRFTEVHSRTDLAGLERVTLGRRT
ncbi:MAG: peptide chain release factor N(5)-glutamine methyltransferase [Gammaproteobacteria bacterium]|nr:peptide chain release factor N(5)-glutamine methyltransferase [Gammaproteobacteria bacterium]